MRSFSSLPFAALLFLPLSLPAAELEQVIVEARKVASEAKAEALAQTTLSEEWISDLYIDSFDELSFFVPGLYVQEEGINSAAYAIRGMTTNNTEATRTPRVSVWLHGMDVSRTQGAYTALYDIERVDVFKGPVGSLFARGGQIGGVNLVNHFAEAGNAGEMAASIGNFNELKLHGFYNATLGEHNAMRVALYHHQRDGYIENSDGNDLNSVDTQAGRISFMQMINDARIDIQANIEQNSPSATSFQSFAYAPAQAFDQADISNADRLFINRDIADVFVRLAQPFSDSLDAEASVLYRDVQSNETFDPDGFSLDLVEANEMADYATLESVFRLNHLSEYHASSMGLAYFHEAVDVRFAASINEQFAIRLPLIQSVIGIPAGTIDTRLFDASGNPDPYTAVALTTARYEQQTETVDNESFSLFFDNTWFITDALSFSYGLRLSRESLHTEIFTPAFSDGGQTTITNLLGNLFLVPENAAKPRSQASIDTQGAAGRLSLSYLLHEQMQVFATYARGRRPDILNYTEQSVLEHLDDETVDSWEIGLALNVPDTYTKLDISLYRYNFRHFATSVSGVSALQVLSDDNASASANGVEIAYTQFFANDILLFSNLGYNDAVFDESAIIKGENRFRYAPQWTGSLSLSKDYTLHADWRSRITWQESFQSEVFFEDDNTSNAGRNRQGSYGLMNMYLDFVYRQNLTLNAFVKNAADKQFLIDAGNFGQLFGLPTFVPGMGRHFGAGVSYRF